MVVSSSDDLLKTWHGADLAVRGRTPNVNLQDIFEVASSGYTMFPGGTPKGLKPFPAHKPLKIRNSKTGTAAWAFEKGTGGDRAVIVGGSGTGGDWVPFDLQFFFSQLMTNAKLLLKKQMPDQVHELSTFLDEVGAEMARQKLPKDALMVVGHSQAGIMMSYLAYHKDYHGVAIASPPIMIDEPYETHFQNLINNKRKFVSVYNEGDPIGNFQFDTRFNSLIKTEKAPDGVYLEHYGTEIVINKSHRQKNPENIGRSLIGNAVGQVKDLLSLPMTLIVDHLIPAQAGYFNVKIENISFGTLALFAPKERSILTANSTFADLCDFARSNDV